MICRGCGTAVPSDDVTALAEWAVVDPDRDELYCPRCLTPAEHDCLVAVALHDLEERLLFHRSPDSTGVFVPEQRRPEPLAAVAQHPVPNT
jgi:hypothetical protein